MPNYHILNGDCLAEQLSHTLIKGDFIVCRECLMDGPVDASISNEFWNMRSEYIAETYSAEGDDYFEKTVSEFEKLHQLPDHSEVCLWFENDLFCQVNMWFVIALLARHPALNIYRVFPVINNTDDEWKGFGISTAEMLESAYSGKIKFETEDLQLGSSLWDAFCSGDLKKLKQLSLNPSRCFNFLEEVCQAHIDRLPYKNILGRPEKIMLEIRDDGLKEFQTAYPEFSKRAGIYGFSDRQMKALFNKIIA
jgi:Domain of unknown function (DUF1835)